LFGFLLGFNFQELEGVHLGPNNGVPFFLLYRTQESRKYNKFGNNINACSSNATVKLMSIKKSIKYFHPKSTSFVDVHAMGRNLYKQLI